MRALAIALVLCSIAAPAAAQHTADVQQVQTLTTCVNTQHTQLARLVRLLGEAHGRLSATDATVRHDAELSIQTLLQRAAEARDALTACLEAADFTAPSGETVVHETTPDSAADHVAASGGSIHQVESDAAVTTHVRVVRGERVDGSGTATDASVRSAVHGAGTLIAGCYEAYVDRVSNRSGTIHVSFTSADGGRVTESTVEAGGFDTELRTCVQRAFRTITIAGAHGRSVYSYEIALGN